MSYAALITWLLSLVPDDFSFLVSPPAEPQFLIPSPFWVIGLQQLYMEVTYFYVCCSLYLFIVYRMELDKTRWSSHGIVTKTVHKSLPEMVGWGYRVWFGGSGRSSNRSWAGAYQGGQIPMSVGFVTYSDQVPMRHSVWKESLIKMH